MADMSLQTTYSEKPAIGYEGQIDGDDYVARPYKNAEASASIAFGRAVVRAAAPTTDFDAVLPSAETDKVIGIVARSNSYEPYWTDTAGNAHGQLKSDGLVPGTMMNVVRRGRMLVKAATAVTPGDRLWVRAVAAGAEYLGALEDADDGTDTIDCTMQGEWQSTASAGGLAWLEFDFINK